MIGGGTVPYSEARIVSFDGHSVRLLDGAGEQDFRGFQVEWLRNAPLRGEVPRPPRECPLVWQASEWPRGDGWSVAEVDPGGRAFRWMAAVEASLRVRGHCIGNTEISVVIAMAMSPDILSNLSIAVAGRAVELQRTASPSGDTVLRGVVPASVLSDLADISITLRVNRTILPHGDSRTLAVAVRELRLETVPQ
jgi:hypothetical protein